MASGDETLMDAPVTPAPIFAYRALRAVFWGDEDTPEKVSNPIHLNPQDVLEPAKKDQIVDTAPTQLTPGQKRKRSSLALPSPTKSIFRTPGAHTPRRALLKELNVKFKDLRKSVSPDLLMKDPPLTAVERSSNLDNKENQPIILSTAAVLKGKATSDGMAKPASVHAVSMRPTSKSLTTNAPTKEYNPITKTTSTSTSIQAAAPNEPIIFDAEKYMQSTEKEMKKLIRYGQKMREYARRQDEENNKLRLLLDELRQENDRLQKELKSSRQSTNLTISTDRIKNEVSKETIEPQPRRDGQSRTHAREKSRTDPEVDFNIVDIKSSKARPDDHLGLSTTLSNHHSRGPLDLKNPAEAKSKSNHQPNSNPHALSPKKRRYLDQEPIPVRPSLSSSSSSAAPTIAPAATAPIAPREQNLPLLTITNECSTRLPFDRLAAARARVRKKAELRRVSAETENGNVNENGNAYGGMNGGRDGDHGKVEVSLVDWAGL